MYTYHLVKDLSKYPYSGMSIEQYEYDISTVKAVLKFVSHTFNSMQSGLNIDGYLMTQCNPGFVSGN